MLPCSVQTSAESKECEVSETMRFREEKEYNNLQAKCKRSSMQCETKKKQDSPLHSAFHL